MPANSKHSAAFFFHFFLRFKQCSLSFDGVKLSLFARPPASVVHVYKEPRKGLTGTKGARWKPKQVELSDRHIQYKSGGSSGFMPSAQKEFAVDLAGAAVARVDAERWPPLQGSKAAPSKFALEIRATNGAAGGPTRLCLATSEEREAWVEALVAAGAVQSEAHPEETVRNKNIYPAQTPRQDKTRVLRFKK